MSGDFSEETPGLIGLKMLDERFVDRQLGFIECSHTKHIVTVMSNYAGIYRRESKTYAMIGACTDRIFLFF